jgi:hypothetical protein
MPKDDDMLNMEGEQPKKKDGKRTKLLALLLIIIMGCCAGGYYLFFMEEDIPLPPPQKLQPNKQGAATPGAKSGAAGKTSNKAAETELPPIDIPKFGNLGEVTQILGDIEMKKHQKELVKLDKEINEIVSGKDKSDRPGGSQAQIHSQVLAMPGAAQTPDQLAAAKAEREARIVAARKDAEDRKAELARLKDNQTTLLSIQGVNGALSATVMNGHGKVAVLNRGSEWNGGRVVSVSRQGIVVNKDGRDVPIRFQSQE